MNPYTVLEAKLDELKEDEDLLFMFKPENDEYWKRVIQINHFFC